MKNLFLFYGEEKLLMEEEIEKFRRKIVPVHFDTVNYIPLDGGKVTYDDIINACNIVPMMSDRKLVVVKDARFFESEKSKEGDGVKKQGAFFQKLEYIPKYTYLILTCEKVDRRKRSYKMIKSKGIVREFKKFSLKDKAYWVRQRLKMYGKSADLQTSYFIGEYTGSLHQTDGELKKISAFLGEKENVQQKHLDDIFYKSLEGNIFEMMDHIGMRDALGAVRVIDRLIVHGEKGIVILYMISKHMMDLITVKTMEGLTFQEIKERSGIHPFVLRKVMAQSKNFNIEELRQSLRLCQELDMDIKKGRIQEKAGLEFLVTNISL